MKETAKFLIKNLIMIKIDNIQYLTIAEYAKEKSVTPQTVYNWISDKKVETRKVMNMTVIKL